MVGFLGQIWELLKKEGRGYINFAENCWGVGFSA
jgi:hypothetical protein